MAGVLIVRAFDTRKRHFGHSNSDRVIQASSYFIHDAPNLRLAYDLTAIIHCAYIYHIPSA